jgi:catechol 2,3-dioxygenase-like lactoylglutathione lyase family enzyme
MAVTHLSHYALEVPTPEAGIQFYRDFGLEGGANGNKAVMRCAGRDQDQVILFEGGRRRLHHLCFGTTEEGFATIKANVEASNAASLVDPPAEAEGEGLWIQDFEDMLYNVRISDPAPSLGGPDATVDTEWKINQPGHYGRLGTRGAPERDMPVKPRRLGHVLHFTTDFTQRFSFYENVLGMRLSDRSGDAIAFMRCAADSDHHVIGLIQHEHTGFHHASFEVGNVDEVGLGGSRMLEKGYKDGWGFGRHVIGSNFFHYIRDPWNGLAEYFADIDFIPADYDWQPKDWPAEDSLYLWGPGVPEDFGHNFEADQ